MTYGGEFAVEVVPASDRQPGLVRQQDRVSFWVGETVERKPISNVHDTAIACVGEADDAVLERDRRQVSAVDGIAVVERQQLSHQTLVVLPQPRVTLEHTK